MSAQLITDLLPYLIPVLKEGGKAVVSAASKDLWELIKGKFTRPEQVEVLEKIEKDPSSAEQQGALRYILDQQLSADPHLAGELTAILNQLSIERPDIKADIIQNHSGSGDNVVNFGNLSK